MQTDSSRILVQSSGAVVYTNCISADGCVFLNECPRYDTKQSDGDGSVNLEL